MKTRLLESRSKSGTNKQITKCGNVNFDWFILPLLLPTLTIWFSLDHKQNVGDRVGSGVKRNGMILLTPGFRHAHDSAYNSDLWFSLGDKLSYNSSNNSDSLASENQPLEIMLSKQCYSKSINLHPKKFPQDAFMTTKRKKQLMLQKCFLHLCSSLLLLTNVEITFARLSR